jgi:hypothetical protein
VIAYVQLIDFDPAIELTGFALLAAGVVLDFKLAKPATPKRWSADRPHNSV